MLNTKLSIEEVEQAFLVWRNNKVGHQPIPDNLWDQVAQLLKTHRRAEVLRRLRVSTQQARDKGIIPSTQCSDVGCVQNTFVQIPVPQPTIQPITQRTSSLTIQRGDTQLCLNHPSDEQIHLIINTLLR
jgi:hypothetical protein